MRQTRDLAAGLAVLLGAGVLVMTVAGRGRGTPDDPRRSTFVAGPSGASGLAAALERIGVEADPLRSRPQALDSVPADSATLLAALGPSDSLDAIASEHFLRYRLRGGHVLLAGGGAASAIRCLGYRVNRLASPVRVAGAGGGSIEPDAPRTRFVLARTVERTFADSSELADGRVVTCAVPPPILVDTILASDGGQPVIVRLSYASGGVAIVASDDSHFSNRVLRETTLGPLLLALVADRHRRVMFDEYHHGFRSAGSLAGALLDWSARSPAGWAVWQLAAVGLAGLVAGAVRFGPARAITTRRRRSQLEHVRALAVALDTPSGQREAVQRMVRGLRRRLDAGFAGDTLEWLGSLEPMLRTAKGRAALDSVRAAMRSEPRRRDLPLVGTALEDIWDDLKR